VSAAPDHERLARRPLALRIGLALWVLVVLGLVLFPVYLVLMVSVAPGPALFGERPALIVTAPTLRFWWRVLARGELLGPLVKSLTVATVATAVALTLAAPGAYAISRWPVRWRHALLVGLLLARMLPELAVGVSVATHFARLGLVDTYLGVIAAHLIGALPFIAWILVGAFAAIPTDLEEAADLDGASRLQTLRQVILPAALPALAVAALFVWLYSWNEFLYARLLTTSQNTLPLQVFQAIDRGTKQQMAAVAAVLVLPILVVVAFLQRYLRPDLLAGALKG
jgi:trehalose transport system permease protein